MQAEHGENAQHGEVRGQHTGLEERADRGHATLLPAGRGRGAWVLSALGAIGLLACAGSLVIIGDLRAHPESSISSLMLGGVFYLLIVIGIARAWPSSSRERQRRIVTGVCALAILLRLMILFVPPGLSDDIYRYRWDGKVQAAGLNPYAEPPAAMSLSPLRDSQWELINYPRIRSIYPPLTQVLFAATYRVDDSLPAFKVLATLGDLLVIALLLALLRNLRLPAWQVALYALHPLVAVEFASSGHVDSWTMAAVLGALLAHVRGRQVLSTTLLAAGILLKTWPLVFVPLLLRRRPWWHGPLLTVLVAGGYAPYLGAGAGLLQPWFEYAGRWRFNDGLFAILQAATGSLEIAKGIVAAAGLGLLAWLWRRDVEPLRGGYWLLIAFIVMMPTVHPWYMLWALPLAAVAVDAGWIALCTLAPLAYAILAGAGPNSDTWVEPVWTRFVEYLPAAGVWAWLALRGSAPAPRPGTDRSVGRTAVRSAKRNGQDGVQHPAAKT